MAQNQTITNTVTDSQNGMPLPGVTVRIIGFQAGITTVADGKYALSVAPGAITIELTYGLFAAFTLI